MNVWILKIVMSVVRLKLIKIFQDSVKEQSNTLIEVIACNRENENHLSVGGSWHGAENVL